MKLVIEAIAIVLVMAFVSCSAASPDKNVNTEQQVQIIEHNLSIHEFGGGVLQSIATVDGKAKNISNLKISSSSISINFYDKDGNLLHTASTIKQNWGKDEIWHFIVQFNSPDAWKTVRYDISAKIN